MSKVLKLSDCVGPKSFCFIKVLKVLKMLNLIN